MSSQGPLSAATGADDASSGTSAWATPGNITTVDAAYAVFAGSVGVTFTDTTIKLVKGGTVTGNNKSAGATVPTTFSYRSFGGASDLWGVALTDTDVNASNFGVVYQSTTSTAVVSHYLKATNFGFTVPSGATIDGIVAEIYNRDDGVRRNQVDHIRMTVYYTAAGGGGGQQTKSVSVPFQPFAAQ